MYNFFSKYERELQGILKELRQYLANNYKTAAHEQRVLLDEKSEAYKDKLPYKRYLYYRKLAAKYNEMMKDYHH